MSNFTVTSKPNSTMIVKEWKELMYGTMYDWAIIQWVHSGRYMLCCSNLDVVINQRAQLPKALNRCRIRRAWTVCRNDEIAARVLKDGIKID